MTTIKVKLSAGSYTARAAGNKTTASSTISARQAAEALAYKLGHNPNQLKAEGEDAKGAILYSVEPRAYDTLVITGMDSWIPSTVRIDDRDVEVTAWASGHALNDRGEMEDFIRQLAKGNFDDPQQAAIELMDRRQWE